MFAREDDVPWKRVSNLEISAVRGRSLGGMTVQMTACYLPPTLPSQGGTT